MLDEVASELGVLEPFATSPLEPHIIRGASLMLPLLHVGTTELHIRTHTGLCALGIWFTRLLGLAVEVTQDSSQNGCTRPPCIQIGCRISRANIRIDASSEEDSCIELYDVREGIKIDNPESEAKWKLYLETRQGEKPVVSRDGFEYVLDPAGIPRKFRPREPHIRISRDHSISTRLLGITRRIARGFGSRILGSAWVAFAETPGDEGRDAYIRAWARITVALALHTAKYLRKSSLRFFQDAVNMRDDTDDGRGTRLANTEYVAEEGSSYIISRNQIMEAARLIFNDDSLNESFDESYKRFSDESRKTLLPAARNLSVLVLAFANAANLDACNELLLNCDIALLDEISLVHQTRNWDGNSSIPVQEGVWFDIVVKLLVDPTEATGHENLDSMTLFSDHGWSIFRIPCLSTDPSDFGKSLIRTVSRRMEIISLYFLEPGKFDIRPGVPSWNGTHRRRIADGSTAPLLRLSCFEKCPQIYKPGETVKFHVEGRFIFEEGYDGIQNDSFITSLRIQRRQKRSKSPFPRCTGNRELSKALWPVLKTIRCECTPKLPACFELPSDCHCEALEVICDDDLNFCTEKLVLCLTGGSSIARWRALIALKEKIVEDQDRGLVKVLLRGLDCCLTCAIHQVPQCLGRCYVVI